MRGTKQPNPIDIAIGARVRARRMQLGMSQETLGARLGISFQQIQKYEKGANRIGGSRLVQIRTALDCPVEYFFADSDPAGDDPLGAIAGFDLLDLKIAREAADLPAPVKATVLDVIRALKRGTLTSPARGELVVRPIPNGTARHAPG